MIAKAANKSKDEATENEDNNDIFFDDAEVPSKVKDPSEVPVPAFAQLENLRFSGVSDGCPALSEIITPRLENAERQITPQRQTTPQRQISQQSSTSKDR